MPRAGGRGGLPTPKLLPVARRSKHWRKDSCYSYSGYLLQIFSRGCSLCCHWQFLGILILTRSVPYRRLEEVGDPHPNLDMSSILFIPSLTDYNDSFYFFLFLFFANAAYFPLAAAVWNLVLSIELCRFVFRHETDLSGSFERARYKWYHAIGWFSPIPCVAALFIAMNIMNEGIWCWVGILSVNGISPLPQMVLWFVVMILNVCVVVAVRNTLLADSNGKSRESAKQAKKFILTLMAYTTTFLVAFLAILIHEMGIGYVHNGPVYGRPKIRYAAAITAPAQGFLNAIIFVLTNSRAREWLFCSTSSRKSSVEEEALGSYREFSEASNAYSSETLVASEASFLSEPRFDENELTEAVMLDDFYRRTSECSVDSTL
eukprot:gb/GECG01013461.1/.p1 GENE.gb/GECG01013461.1/~~gb/GECG01013461.1/.p1  ORF type:complete len:375 (+),score=13.63 gb/GECG01013461.1/:1-1125(+)